MSASDQNPRKGLLYALSCYLIWGLFPIYWYPLNHSAMPAMQIMAHRVLWSAVFALILVCRFRQLPALFSVFRTPKLLAAFACTSLLIGTNWLVYVWSVTNNHVLDASLGYFINPMFNIFLGATILKERLGRTQWLAVALALTGIVWLAVPAGQIPWIALILAFSFGMYGLIRKLVPTDTLTGMTVETLILLPAALAYLTWCAVDGQTVFGGLNTLQTAVLLGSGAATTLTLMLFTAAAKHISLSLVGILQYISPSIQLLCGLLLFGEQLNGNRLIGYMWVWLGVAVFLWDAWRRKAV
ncbi:EamA family transporter RarD [Neisseria sp.]|uniref:EamA family transporter RarD n=1 Tax=Neisseria sp. TaxID=192066 RepID=UPI0035A1B74B